MPLDNFPKHQTVAWWIKELQKMPDKKAIVKLSTNFMGKPRCVLSIYEGADKTPTVWIDLGKAGYEQL